MLTQEAFNMALAALLPKETDRPPLLAVSGGVDSIVLLHLFSRTGRPAIVAHCNFQLRGAASDADELLVRQLAEKLKLPFASTSFDTKDYAKGKGISLQMAARELRYSWFADLQKEGRSNGVLTAHHLNDSVETFLINVSRGTGLSGLTGIAHTADWGKEKLRIWRPLLGFPRSAIEACAQREHWDWREDESNAKDDYLRNYLRHHVVTAWEKGQPGILASMAHNMQILQETASNFRFLLQKLLPLKIVGLGKLSLDISAVLSMPFPASALWEVLHEYGFDAEQTRQMVACAGQPGTLFESEQGTRLLVDRDRYVLDLSATNATPPPVCIEQDDIMVRLPDGGSITLMPVPVGTAFPDGKMQIIVDASQLKYPLKVRNWLPGDVFFPFGMNGKSRKLQDYFTDLKMNRFEKEQVKLLLNGDDAIIWVAGLRMDERFKVSEVCTTWMKMSWAPPDAGRN